MVKWMRKLFKRKASMESVELPFPKDPIYNMYCSPSEKMQIVERIRNAINEAKGICYESEWVPVAIEVHPVVWAKVKSCFASSWDGIPVYTRLAMGMAVKTNRQLGSEDVVVRCSPRNERYQRMLYEEYSKMVI